MICADIDRIGYWHVVRAVLLRGVVGQRMHPVINLYEVASMVLVLAGSRVWMLQCGLRSSSNKTKRLQMIVFQLDTPSQGVV
jgi:hypothetical protein